MLLLTLAYCDEILSVFICLRLVPIYNVDNKIIRNNNGNGADNHNSDDVVVDNDVDDNDDDVQWKTSTLIIHLGLNKSISSN